MKLYHYAASANCYKVRLLLAQLDRPHQRVHIDIFAGDTLTEEYAAKNPARATPVLELEDGALLVESNAILFYLAQGTPFLPAGPLDLAQVVRWLVFEQTDVMMTMGGLRFRLLTGRLTGDHPDAVRRREGALEALAFSTFTCKSETSSSQTVTRSQTSRSTVTRTLPPRSVSSSTDSLRCSPG
jgi:glutathione S-transferase